jgi:hypothetical protein
MPERVRWTNIDSTGIIDRRRNLTFRWTPGVPAQWVAAAGINSDEQARATAAFLCLEESGVGSLTAPAPVLQSLPRSGRRPGVSRGYLLLGTVPKDSPYLQFPGVLGALLASGVSIEARAAVFR